MHRLNHSVYYTSRRRKSNMTCNWWSNVCGAALVGLMILGFAVPSGQNAPTVTLTAMVQDRKSVVEGKSQELRNSHITPIQLQGVQCQWDFTNNGSVETHLSANTTMNHV